MSPTPQGLLTIEEVAPLLRVTPRTLARKIRSGELPSQYVVRMGPSTGRPIIRIKPSYVRDELGIDPPAPSESVA